MFPTVTLLSLLKVLGETGLEDSTLCCGEVTIGTHFSGIAGFFINSARLPITIAILAGGLWTRLHDYFPFCGNQNFIWKKTKSRWGHPHWEKIQNRSHHAILFLFLA